MRKAVVAGVLLAVGLAGCSSQDVSGKTTSGPLTAKPDVRATVTAATAAARTVLATPSLGQVVRVGTFCAQAGVVARNAEGVQTRCSRPNREVRARWVIDEGAASDGSVRPGAYCPELGAGGLSKGQPYSCTSDPGGRPRWRANN
jgi:hypothetical protein